MAAETQTTYLEYTITVREDAGRFTPRVTRPGALIEHDGHASEAWSAASCASHDRALLVAEDAADGIVGTVQVVFAQPENQPHRADIAKMLVHRRARRRGIGAMLMEQAEATARAAGKTVLVLDTATGSDAERLYQRLGWQRVGVVPDYALWPDGRLCATTYYYKAVG